MSRPIEFRAWDKDSKKMWIPDFILKNSKSGWTKKLIRTKLETRLLANSNAFYK